MLGTASRPDLNAMGVMLTTENRGPPSINAILFVAASAYGTGAGG